MMAAKSLTQIAAAVFAVLAVVSCKTPSYTAVNAVSGASGASQHGMPPGPPPGGKPSDGSDISNGLGSPVIYSTADITVSNATLVSNQSFSGDAESGSSHFTMSGGSLTSKSGHMFHVTNTNAVISLKGVKLVNEDSGQILMSVCSDGWEGDSNVATLNADGQVLSCKILVGSDSSLKLSLTGESVFTGSIDGNITDATGAKVSSEVGTVDVSLGDGCSWVLTDDTHISSFDGDLSSVKANGHRLYVGGKVAV